MCMKKIIIPCSNILLSPERPNETVIPNFITFLLFNNTFSVFRSLKKKKKLKVKLKLIFLLFKISTISWKLSPIGNSIIEN